MLVGVGVGKEVMRRDWAEGWIGLGLVWPEKLDGLNL